MGLWGNTSLKLCVLLSVWGVGTVNAILSLIPKQTGSCSLGSILLDVSGEKCIYYGYFCLFLIRTQLIGI